MEWWVIPEEVVLVWMEGPGLCVSVHPGVAANPSAPSEPECPRNPDCHRIHTDPALCRHWGRVTAPVTLLGDIRAQPAILAPRASVSVSESRKRAPQKP